MIAHIGGIPVEETLPSLAGTGGALLLARAWLALHLRRHADRGEEEEHRGARI